MSISFSLVHVVAELFDDPYTALAMTAGISVAFFYEIQLHSDYKARRLNRT
jgi:hypothetical protein